MEKPVFVFFVCALFAVSTQTAALDGLTVSIASDCQLIGHPVFNFTWEPNPNATKYEGILDLSTTESNPLCVELLDQFLYNISVNQTYLVIRGNAVSFNCSYTFTLTSYPDENDTSIDFYAEVPDINFHYDCSATFDSSKFLYALKFQWSFATDDCLAFAAIKNFNASLYQSNSNVLLQSTTTQPHKEGHLLQFNGLLALINDFYQFKLFTIIKDELAHVFSTTKPLVCNISAPPVPPRDITNIVISQYTVYDNTTATISAVWSQADNINSGLTQYQVRINDSSQVLLSINVPANQPFINRKITVRNSKDQLYLEIRATSKDCQLLADPCYSNWSKPILINETTCYLSSNNLTQPFESEEEALLNAQCFAACTDEFASDSVSNLETTWPSVDISSHSCNIQNKILRCHRGCLIKFKEPTLQNYHCADKCVNDCKSLCNGDITCSTRSRCKIKCKHNLCRKGCVSYNRIRSSDIIISAIGYPVLTPIPSMDVGGDVASIDGGIFNISLTPSTTTTTGSTDHTYLIRVQVDHAIYYLWQQTLANLNLTYFNCQTVNVSVAIVTATGISSYTGVSGVYVYGETRFADHPLKSSMQLDVKEDFRKKFFGHAILNITWKQPEVGIEHLDYYEVIVYSLSRKCGGVAKKPFHYIIDKNVTSLILQSKRRKDLPKFICSYYYQVYSRPSDPRNPPQFVGHTIRTVTGEPPKAKFDCISTQEAKTGIIFVLAYWSIPCDPYLFQVIRRFDVWTNYITVENRTLFQSVQEFTRPPSNYCRNYTYFFSLEPRTDQYSMLSLTLSYLLNNTFPWRLTPDEVQCFISTRSLPPSAPTINSIQINKLTNIIINITLNWDPPAFTYGNITKYEIILSKKPLLFDENVNGVDKILVETQDVTTNNLLIVEPNTFLPNISCIYIQMKAHNKYSSSEWSDSVTISKLSNACSPSPSLSSSYPSPSSDIVGSGDIYSKPSQFNGTSLPNFSSYDSLIISSVPPALFVFFVVIGFIIVLTLCCINCQKRRKLQKTTEEAAMTFQLSTRNSSIEQIQMYKNPYKIQVDSWELEPDIINVDSLLSEGAFGKVYKGHIIGPLTNGKIPNNIRKNGIIPVAIKIVKGSSAVNEKCEFLQEIDLTKKISEGNNSHIVSMIGCVTTQEPFQLVTFLVKYGNLYELLKYIRNEVLPQNIDTKTIVIPNDNSIYSTLGEITNIDLLGFAYQIASGMEYLADLKIIHRDLATRNVLVDERKCLKLADFGLSRMTDYDEIYVRSSKGRLPWKWLAIESLASKEFTSASDVWSFGITLWEIATFGGYPYPSVSNMDMLNFLQDGGRLEKPENCSNEIYCIMQECWAADPKNRPAFMSLKAKFHELMLAEIDSPYIELSIDMNQPYYNLISEDLFGASSDDDTSENQIDAKGLSLAMDVNDNNYDRMIQEANIQ